MAREEKVFWCVAREVDHIVRISSMVLDERRDCVGGAGPDVLVVPAAVGAEVVVLVPKRLDAAGAVVPVVDVALVPVG